MESNLVNLTTNLKSLEFGKDRPDQGDSGQPYMTTDIPEGTGYGRDGLPTRSGPDFILRDGFLAPVKGFKDLGRLAKMFFDFKSPRGLLFILKQNLLSRTGVKTEASKGAGYAGGLLNEGVYLPLGTLIDAGLGWAGIHMNKQGIDPIGTLRGPNGVIGNENGLMMGGNLAINGYQQIIGQQTDENFSNLEKNEESTNRLVAIYNSVQLGTGIKNWNKTKISIQPDATEDSISPVMLKYGGGPGSILGIGKTKIFFSDNRTGKENPKISLTGFFKNENNKIIEEEQPYDEGFSPLMMPPVPVGPPNISVTDVGFLDYSVFKRKPIDYKGAQIFLTTVDGDFGGASGLYQFMFDWYLQTSLITEEDFDVANDDGVGGIQKFQNSVYMVDYEMLANILDPNVQTEMKDFLLVSGDRSKLVDSGELAYRTWRHENLVKNGPDFAGISTLYPQDFRTQIISDDEKLKTGSDKNSKNLTVDDPTAGKSKIIALAPSYKNKNRTRRVNQGDPGQHKTGMGPEIKNIFRYGLPAYELEALDKITAQPMYESTGPNTALAVNDFVKFRFKILKNEAGDNGVYLHFRAYIDSFSDAYSANWGAVNYVGRGEPMYNYQGFARQISLSFTVVAESKAELVPMLSKLNYLASSMAPDYGDNGFMKGNLVKLTLGAYLYEMPGAITSLNYDISEESPWEIAIDDSGGADKTVAELPKMIKVTMAFQPIHKFLSQKDSDYMNPASKFISMARAEDDGLYADMTKYKSYPADGDSDIDDTNNIPGE